ncbi:Ger(x)C family spore germination protein [Neobacillus cucumis]|uniref:Ger(x)C family spore germination protein n=1 Tax=Neobacillus cucumis TaxID=1740721 RepID=UPI0018E04E0B|nr:Ger(x)C family spore germination protein [Neobacillus cucumis]MBI0579476.1 Ger(x)C family spore germination protein [Neobacillus cucumis]
MANIQFWKKIFIPICSIILLTGCWDIRAVENMWYINALGIDFKNNHYVIYPQLINFSTFAKQEAAANRTPQSIFVGKGSGEILDDAAFDFYKTAQQQVSWEHIKVVLLSENVLRNGKIKEVDEFLGRFFQFRNTMWIFGTNQPVQDVLVTGTILNISPLYSIMEIPNEMIKNYSIFQPTKLFKFRANLYEPAMTTFLPFLAVEKKSWKEDKKNFPVLKYDGSAFLASWEYKGFLSQNELLGLIWTEKKMKRASVPLKQDGKPIVEVVLTNPTVKTSAYIKDNLPHFHMEVKLNGDIFQMNKDVSIGTLQNLAEEAVKKEIERTYIKGLKKEIDIFQLSEHLYRNQVREWKKLEKNGIVELSPSSLTVDVKVKLNTSGQWKPSSLKNSPLKN